MPSESLLWWGVAVAMIISFFALGASIDQDQVLEYGNVTFGEMGIDNDEAITISAANTYYNITGFPWNFSTTHNVYFNGSALYINESGVYAAWHIESFSGAANTEFHLTLGVNGVAQQPCEAHRKLGTGGDVGSSSGMCMLKLDEGDYVIFQVENEDGVKDITLSHVNVRIVLMEQVVDIV